MDNKNQVESSIILLLTDNHQIIWGIDFMIHTAGMNVYIYLNMYILNGHAIQTLFNLF